MDYVDHEAVVAVYVAGSSVTGEADPHSDLDIYVLTDGQIDLSWREQLIGSRLPLRYSLAPGHFGDGDAWETDAGKFDVMFWEVSDTIENLRSILDHHVPRLGYTTAFWHTVRTWQERGRSGRSPEKLAELEELAGRDYPDALARAIVDHNAVLLRGVMFSLEEQLSAAQVRQGPVSIQHRTTAILASWFDIVFAVNRRTHPGEKRLLNHLKKLPSQPRDADPMIRELVAKPDRATETCRQLLDQLFDWLRAEGYLP